MPGRKRLVGDDPTGGDKENDDDSFMSPDDEDVIGDGEDDDDSFTGSDDEDVIGDVEDDDDGFTGSDDEDVIGDVEDDDDSFTGSDDEDVIGDAEDHDDSFTGSDDDDVIGDAEDHDAGFTVSGDEDVIDDGETVFDPALLEAGRILSADEMGELRGLDRLIKRSRDLADRRLAEVERVREQGRKDGFQEGSQEAARLLASISLAGQQERSRAFDEIVDIVMTAMQMLIDGYDRAELVAESVKKTLSEHGKATWRQGEAALTLVVHPDIQDDVRQRLQSLLTSEDAALIDVESDRQLSPSDSLLTSRLGAVELGLERQLEAIRRGLSKGTSSMALDAGDPCHDE